MKKLLAIVAFAFLGMVYAQAQETPVVPADLTETMIQELELTAEQNGSISKILGIIQPAMENIRNSNLNETDKAAKLIAYANREKLNMKNILTDTQFVKYLELTGRI
jgi:uncharacterized iron-regulated protein